jgi:O-antigen/teichoic acid export membrane protein
VTPQNFLSLILEKTRRRRGYLGTFFSLVGINATLAGLSFATTLLVAALLGSKVFGDFSYALVVGAYCSTIAYCGLENTMVRDLVQKPEEHESTISASILLRGALLFLGLVAITGLNLLAPDDGRLTAAGLLIVFAEGAKALYLAPVYDAWNAMKRHAYYLLAERLLYFTGVWTVLIFFRDRLSLGVLAASIVASTILGLVLQYRWALGRFTLCFTRETVGRGLKILRGNLWIWSAVLATLSIGGLSKILLKQISGSSQLGGYAVAWQVILLSSLLFTQIGRMANPGLSRIVLPSVAIDVRVRFLVKYVLLSTLAAAVFGLPAILFPEAILNAINPEYLGATGTLRLLGVYAIVLGMGQAGAQYLIAIRYERVYSLVVIFTGGLSLILNLALIPSWGSEGAAFAVIFSHGFALFVYAIITVRHVWFPQSGDQR